jgi:hypothetical protein
MDNCYNAPTLAITLKFIKTDCVETLCLSRKDISKIVKDNRLRKGGNYSSAFWPSIWGQMV